MNVDASSSVVAEIPRLGLPEGWDQEEPTSVKTRMGLHRAIMRLVDGLPLDQAEAMVVLVNMLAQAPLSECLIAVRAIQEGKAIWL